MEFIIDNRESTKTYFQNKNKEWIKFKNLDIGDYLLNFNNEPLAIIERKTVEDLANSIKDGRYREQKSRLLENYSKKNIIYLLEGDLTKSNKAVSFNKVSKETIYSSIINLLLRDNLNLFITNNMKESIEFLENLCVKIQKNGNKFIEKINDKEEAIFNNLKKKTKKNITKELVYKLQLSSIPGISLKTAQVIVDKYPTLPKLINSLINIDENERIKLVKNIEYNLDNNKKRKLGKKIAENLNKFIFN